MLLPGLGHGMIGRMPVYRSAHQMRRAYDLFALEKDPEIGFGLKLNFCLILQNIICSYVKF